MQFEIKVYIQKDVKGTKKNEIRLKGRAMCCDCIFLLIEFLCFFDWFDTSPHSNFGRLKTKMFSGRRYETQGAMNVLVPVDSK